MKPMTKTILFLATALALPSVLAQSPPPVGLTPAPRSSAGASEPALTNFDLDFLGGTPKQLVTSIQGSMGKPLNALIPPEYADTKLPPLKMSNVDVRQLFLALELTSSKTEAYSNPGYSPGYQQIRTSYGFRTQGQVSDESIWYFYVEKPTLPPIQVRTTPKVCRYFSLSPYLDRGQTVDDITTAIQTGWKMLGDDDTPKISFHKETKLLIAVGEPGKLETIDAVLNALKSVSSSPSFIDPATRLPVIPAPAIPPRTLKAPPAGADAVPGSTPAPSKP